MHPRELKRHKKTGMYGIFHNVLTEHHNFFEFKNYEQSNHLNQLVV